MKNNKNQIPDRIYREIMDNVPTCCVDIVFLNKKKGKTLLFKRNNEPAKGTYFTCGGRLFKEETLIECAIRQAKKELGLNINPKKLFFVGVTQDNYKNSIYKGVSSNIVNIFYGYILNDENVNLQFDKQHSDHKWFDVRDKTLHPYIKERMRQTLLILKK